MNTALFRLFARFLGAELLDPGVCLHMMPGGGQAFTELRGKLTRVYICTQCGTVGRERYRAPEAPHLHVN